MKYYYSILIIFLLYSCDCYFNIDGKVIDEKTLKPIKNVFITNDFCNKTCLTNNKGEFKFNKTRGICDDENFHFNKKGYKSKTILLQNLSSTNIELEPIE